MEASWPLEKRISLLRAELFLTSRSSHRSPLVWLISLSILQYTIAETMRRYNNKIKLLKSTPVIKRIKTVDLNCT
jgi:hypothetical protein